MQNRLFLALILASVPSTLLGQEDDAKAKAVAQETLNKGAALFDKRDANAMAATFVENAQIILCKRSSDSGNFETETRSGRTSILQAYADIFKDRSPEHKAKNTVDSAKFLGKDLLLIHGKFSLNQDDGDSIRFVQIRTREGEEWKVVTMQLFELEK